MGILNKIIGGFFDKKQKTSEDLYLEYWENKQKKENRRDTLIILFFALFVSLIALGLINLIIHK